MTKEVPKIFASGIMTARITVVGHEVRIFASNICLVYNNLMIPNPYIAGLPLQAWFGVLAIIVLFLQILTGRRILKLPAVFHFQVFVWLLVVLAIIHGMYGLSFYFS